MKTKRAELHRNLVFFLFEFAAKIYDESADDCLSQFLVVDSLT